MDDSERQLCWHAEFSGDRNNDRKYRTRTSEDYTDKLEVERVDFLSLSLGCPRPDYPAYDTWNYDF